jgi:acetate kinase
MMSTRSGDIDPTIPQFLNRQAGVTSEAFATIATKQSGLLGVSETSADMYELVQAYDRDPRATEAVDLFCYQVRKAIGSYAAVLGGVDTLIFSGGIGENSEPIRGRICAGLEFLGMDIKVVHADEAGVIARSTAAVIGETHATTS